MTDKTHEPQPPAQPIEKGECPYAGRRYLSIGEILQNGDMFPSPERFTGLEETKIIGGTIDKSEWYVRLIDAHPEPKGARELAYAIQIATYGVRKFTNVPNWKPLDTMMGVLSQIDNLLAGTLAPKGAEVSGTPAPGPENMEEAFGEWFKSMSAPTASQVSRAMWRDTIKAAWIAGCAWTNLAFISRNPEYFGEAEGQTPGGAT